MVTSVCDQERDYIEPQERKQWSMKLLKVPAEFSWLIRVQGDLEAVVCEVLVYQRDLWNLADKYRVCGGCSERLIECRALA